MRYGPRPCRPLADCVTLRFVSAHEHVELRRDVPELAPVSGIGHVGRELLDQPGRVDQVAHEHGATLEREGHVGDPPAVVLRADAAPDRHPHLVEEQLAELRRAEHGLEGPHLDAGQVHRQHQPADALVLRHVRVGAHEELADVADLAVRAPDLLAGHHVVVAVAHRPGAQRREVRARARLREPLAPHLVAPQDLREVGSAFCSGVPSATIVGPACRSPTKFTPTYGARAFVVSSRKISCWVGDASWPPYSFGQLSPAYPASKRRRCQSVSHVRRGGPVVAGRLGRHRRQRGGEELPQPGAELLVGG